MDRFFQAVALALLAVVMVLILRQSNRGIAELLSVLVCCMALGLGLQFIEPVVEFIRSFGNLEGLNSEMLTIILKVVGISVTAEIAALLCDDSGNSAIGKALQFLATGVILCLSMPMLTAFLQLIEGILKGL